MIFKKEMKLLLIRNCETEGFGYIEEYLIENKIEYSIFEAYREVEFPNPNETGAVIVGGTPLSACNIDRYKYLVNEWNFLKDILDSGKPYFGICFGAQILARLLGADVKRNPVMEIGNYEVSLTESGKRSKYFLGFHEKFPVFHWHGDTFDIPDNAHQLVTGIDCINQSFCLGNAIGVQFHLEVSPDEAAKWADMYSDELKVIGKTKAQIVEDCAKIANELKSLTFKLMDNFLRKNH